MLTPPQLILDWTSPSVLDFDHFLPGGNAEVVGHLRALAAGTLSVPSVLIWGAPGSGRTHLLKATLDDARRNGNGRIAEMLASVAIPVTATAGALYGLDGVDALSSDAEGRLFTFYNACRDAGAQLLLTAHIPAARLPVRDDLRTRIGAGLILEVRPLADAEKPAALAAYAHEQGFRLSTDVIGYLLTRGRRDMGALITHLRALDRYSLATKRPVTVPLVRELLGGELFEDPS